MGRRMRAPSWDELVKLERKGYITRAADFAAHMHPDVVWIDNEDFAAAFAAEARRPDMTDRSEAAYTQPDTNYPGYVNVRLNEEQTHMEITVRSPHQSNASMVAVPIEDWGQLLADASFVRRSARPERVEFSGYAHDMPGEDTATAHAERVPGAEHPADAVEVELTDEAELALVDAAPEVHGDGAALARAGDPTMERIEELRAAGASPGEMLRGALEVEAENGASAGDPLAQRTDD